MIKLEIWLMEALRRGSWASTSLAKGLARWRILRFLVLFAGCALVALPELGMAQSAGFYLVRNSAPAAQRTNSFPSAQAALDAAQPGETVLINNMTVRGGLRSVRSGGASLPIRIQGVGSAAIVDWIQVGHSDIVVDGLTITGVGRPAYQAGVVLAGSVVAVAIKNCRFSGSPNLVYSILGTSRRGQAGIEISGNRFENPGFHAVSLYGVSNVIRGNFFQGTNGWDAIRLLSSSTIITGNTFSNWSNMKQDTSNHPDLIQGFANNGEVATNNYIVGNRFIQCRGMQIGNVKSQAGTGGLVRDWWWYKNIYVDVDDAVSLSAPGMRFINNLFYRCGKNTSGPLLLRSSVTEGRADDCLILNNIFLQCGSRPEDERYGWYSMVEEVNGLVAECNLVCGEGDGTEKVGFATGRLEYQGLNGVNPMLRSLVGVVDASPLPGSPVLGKGTNVPLPEILIQHGGGLVVPADIGPVQVARPARLPAPRKTN